MCSTRRRKQSSRQRTRRRRPRTPPAKRGSTSPSGLSSLSWSAPFPQAIWPRSGEASGTSHLSSNRRRSGAAFSAAHRSNTAKGVVARTPFVRTRAGLPRLALHALDVPVDDGEVFILHALPFGDAL